MCDDLFSRSLLERVELVNIRWELWEISVLLLAFAIAQFAFYSCLPYLLKMTSATALNLNLLATDYYTIVAGIVFFNYKVSYFEFSHSSEQCSKNLKICAKNKY